MKLRLAKTLKFTAFFTALALTACATPAKTATPAAPAEVDGYLARPEVQAFIDKLVNEDHFQRAQLEKLFSSARHSDDVIARITKPAESLPWYRYRGIFLTDARATGGARFLAAHRAALDRAQKVYGVPPRIVTAIIGVESNYGLIAGRYPVIDALATLGFDYPPRATFFRKELHQYLLLAREQHFDPAKMQGSYAGALGAPQFISSSYRQYAVDFDGDGRSDLWTDWDDIIGSVANYFAENGWQRGGAVAVRATPPAHPAAAKLPDPMKPTTVGALRTAGFTFADPVADDADAVLVALDDGSGKTEYWVGLHNFVVITRYNRSPLYAMAVYQLSQAISKANGGN
ncbi:MAG TPA: lytic murein transglycosylase B [Gammaproteobacteria bacterium]|nr:lytic murein transglycosylase B [Gammaproteobacteria bacterium]